MAAPSASIFAMARSARARTSATWALPFAAKLPPVRRGGIPGIIRLGLQAISRCLGALTRVGDVAFELIPRPLVGRLQLVGRGFRLVRDLLELCAQIPVSHRCSYVSDCGLSASPKSSV